MSNVNQRAINANPLRAIRHADGMHKRVIAMKVGKGSYRRNDRKAAIREQHAY